MKYAKHATDTAVTQRNMMLLVPLILPMLEIFLMMIGMLLMIVMMGMKIRIMIIVMLLSQRSGEFTDDGVAADVAQSPDTDAGVTAEKYDIHHTIQ